MSVTRPRHARPDVEAAGLANMGDDDWDDGFDYEDLRRQSSVVRKLLTVGIAVIVVVLLVVGAVGVWVSRQIDPSGPPGVEVRITVPTGATTSAIASLLEDKKVITNATVFGYYVRYKSAGPFQAGDYVLRENSSMGDAINVLDAGPLPVPTKTLTVPPGLTIPEIVTKIIEQFPTFSAQRLGELLAPGSTEIRSRFQPPEVASLEGFLFPETYQVAEGADEKAILAMLVAQFDAVATEAGIEAGAAALGLSPYQIVIIASLIEEEAKIPEDQAKIARVIYNRIAQGMTLGIDASLCYGRPKPCQLTSSDLEADTPYNLRIHTGLPPSPIAAPGAGALAAALHPAEGDWLYYVLDPDATRTPPGGHFFTSDFDEFNEVKQQCEDAGLGCG